MLYRGADVNIRDGHRVTPLLAACMLGNEKVVGMLMQFGADPMLKTRLGVSAHSWAEEEVAKENALFVVVDKSFFGLFKRWVLDPLVNTINNLKIRKKEDENPKTPTLEDGEGAAAGAATSEGGDGKDTEKEKENDDRSVDSEDKSTSSKELDESVSSLAEAAAGAVELSPEEKEIEAMAAAEGGVMPVIEVGHRGCAHLVLTFKMSDFYRLRNAVLADSFAVDPCDPNYVAPKGGGKTTNVYMNRMQEVLSSGVNINIKNAVSRY
jgi:hypothetical protein